MESLCHSTEYCYSFPTDGFFHYCHVCRYVFVNVVSSNCLIYSVYVLYLLRFVYLLNVLTLRDVQYVCCTVLLRLDEWVEVAVATDLLRYSLPPVVAVA